MCRYERFDRFEGGRRNDRGFEPRFTVRPAVLLPLFAAYALGFVVLYPLAQASVSRSTAEGNDPIAHIGE